ncbi:MAG: ABC transporter permease [Aerococcaceae bacterium]|nr:ABC transporter permease [Aerococcaceae bacterium]
MKLWNMTYFQLKRIIKMPSIIGIILFYAVMAFGISMMMSSSNSSVSSNETVIILAAENEALHERLAKTDYPASDTTLEAALEQLAAGKLAMVYHIPENYLATLAPIKIYSRSPKAHEVLFETTFHQLMKETLTQETLLKYEVVEASQAYQPIENTAVVAIKEAGDIQWEGVSFMIVVSMYIMMNSVIFGSDLTNFKKNYVLKRAILTPNTNLGITFSFFLAYAIIMSVVYGGIFTIFALNHTMTMTQLGFSLIALFLSVGFSLAMSLVLFRLFKEPGLCQTFGMLFSIGMLSLTMAPNFIESEWVTNISYLSPQTWLVEMLDKQQLLPGALIILLMIAVLLTSGSIKLEKYLYS